MRQADLITFSHSFNSESKVQDLLAISTGFKLPKHSVGQRNVRDAHIAGVAAKSESRGAAHTAKNV